MRKTCKACKLIYEGDKCPNCGNQEYVESSKGRVVIIDPEHSEVAQHVNLKNKGAYAIRL